MEGNLRGPTAKCLAATVVFLALSASAIANEAPAPHDVPQHAAEALALAHKWRGDAILIDVRTRQSMDYALEFGFRSPSTTNRFSVIYTNGRTSAQVQPPISASDGGAIPLPFLDLPAALLQAKQQGMSSSLKEASLDVGGYSAGRTMLTWSLQPNTDHFPYIFKVNANARIPAANTLVAANTASTTNIFRAAAAAPSSIFPVHMAATSAASEVLWQKGTTYYNRKDFRDAVATYLQAANLGHPRAMAVLGAIYHDGEGVTKDLALAVKWYTQAALLGNRGAQYSLGAMYEEGDGVVKNVPKAAQLYEASARQGMPEAQFALGLSYEFGEGVPRNRRTAIFWLDQVAKQGDGRAKWYADWLSRPDTPQFRDEAELGRYTAAKVQQRMISQMGVGNKAPIGTLNGFGPTERSERASTLDAAGETNRAAECRSSGHC